MYVFQCNGQLSGKRSLIEGRFGTSKREYGLDQILTKLISTSKSVIAMTHFVMNTEKNIRLLRLLISLLMLLWIAICFLVVNWLKGEILAFI
jgi:hypothetical protein